MEPVNHLHIEGGVTSLCRVSEDGHVDVEDRSAAHAPPPIDAALVRRLILLDQYERQALQEALDEAVMTDLRRRYDAAAGL